MAEIKKENTYEVFEKLRIAQKEAFIESVKNNPKYSQADKDFYTAFANITF